MCFLEVCIPNETSRVAKTFASEDIPENLTPPGQFYIWHWNVHISVYFRAITMIFYANESWTFVLYIRTNNYTLKHYTPRFFTQNVAKSEQFLVLSVSCTTFHNCMWTKFKNLEVFWNSPEVCCGNKIHNLILNIYDHGTQKCRIARSSLFSDDTILKVNEILTTALLKAPGGFPLSRFKAHCDQLTSNPDEFVRILSLHGQ